MVVGRNGHSRPMYLNPILYLIEFTCTRSDELSRAIQLDQSTYDPDTEHRMCVEAALALHLQRTFLAKSWQRRVSHL